MTSWTPDLDRRPGPRYRAIADALAEEIANGRLPPNTRLPTHRELAYRLSVTVGTVTRAYAEAERRGLIGGEVGRGTYVRGAVRGVEERTDATTDWQAPAEGTLINMSVCQPAVAGVEQAVAATMAAIVESGRLESLLNYSPHAGLPAHRAAAARWVTRQHRALATADSLAITVGAQNAMAVALASVARPGDLVLAEGLTYHGFKAVAATLGMELEPVAVDRHGILPDALEAACRRSNPRALYLVPTLHNPTACVLPADRRMAVAEIARRHGLVLIEDDVFGFLAPDAPPPIQTLAPERTIYITSMSKSAAAGLRIGYLVTPPALMPKVEATLRALHYTAPALLSELASRWIDEGQADRFAAQQRDEATARQTIARAVLPSETVSGHPSAQHLWLSLPDPWRREDFVATARQNGVAVTGAAVFAVGRTATPHAVRIGLCMPRTREEVGRGARILAEVLESHHPMPLSIV